MASPGKVEMAVQLLAQGAAQRRWVQQSVLMLDLVAVALMGVLNWSWARA
jgi:lactate permease